MNARVAYEEEPQGEWVVSGTGVRPPHEAKPASRCDVLQIAAKKDRPPGKPASGKARLIYLLSNGSQRSKNLPRQHRTWVTRCYVCSFFHFCLNYFTPQSGLVKPPFEISRRKRFRPERHIHKYLTTTQKLVDRIFYFPPNFSLAFPFSPFTNLTPVRYVFISSNSPAVHLLEHGLHPGVKADRRLPSEVPPRLVHDEPVIC